MPIALGLGWCRAWGRWGGTGELELQSSVEIDRTHRPHSSVIDVAERQYRSRFQPSFRDEVHVTASTVDGSSHTHRPVYKETTRVDEFTVDAPSHRPIYQESIHVDETTVDGPSHRPIHKESYRATETTVDAPVRRPYFHKDVTVVEETVDTPRYAPSAPKSKMGYYDEDGHYHSLRHSVHKLADKVLHHHHEGPSEVTEVRESRRSRSSASEESAAPNTVTIPCHHIRLGDILILQGRPCQVIRISTSSATGQHRYLGVDLFTKQLHEESSFVSNPAPSVVVQTMLGPVFKQYRVLDMQEGSIVAMTETGDVKQNLPVIDQSSLYSRLQKAFESGRGSVRVLVVSDHGREMAVDMKVVHGSRL
ncbi:hypothetical protein B0T22DRAFT_438405 [Podospora appendiculata]|uniref:Translation elongation factor IF5A C-terminal domain-containing protein n=1 Tax=Podospora appendiculata TaxID=314037 RepID=A0AAE1CI16_9PEZI|nr:hypothetical protein B0T22DRAFT_438405 [Podospora appendiculata]